MPAYQAARYTRDMPQSLPPDVLLTLVVVVALVVLTAVVALTMVALRPTHIKASRGSKVDYSPRAKVEVTRAVKDEDDTP